MTEHLFGEEEFKVNQTISLVKEKFKAIIFSLWMSHPVVIRYRAFSRTPHPSELEH